MSDNKLVNIIRDAANRIQASCGLRLPEARLEAELLAAHCLAQQRSYVFSHSDLILDSEQLGTFGCLVAQRCEGYPLAYITGVVEFWSLPFKVDHRVLIPRADTELLVETALTLPLACDAVVADLGTGSGAIAIALATERPSWRLIAVDLSADAIAVAADNALRISNAKTRAGSLVSFVNGHWLDAFSACSLDLLIANPPYIEVSDPHLQGDGVRYEPAMALSSGEAGLDDIEQIICQARSRLKPGGFILLEHGYRQSDEVVNLLAADGFEKISVLYDLAQIARGVLAKKKLS